MRRTALLIASAVLLVAPLAGCSDDATKSVASKRLPAVTLQGFDGAAPVDLRSLKGPLVVNLWASWCGPCKRELPIYADYARSHAGKVGVLGINFQETKQDKAQALIADSGVRYPNLADPDGALRAQALPKLLLVDADGKVAYSEYVEIKSERQLEKLVADHLGVAG
ncbi:TlpA family protein disulfide reductase [Marmoricola sp. RAF53]|uniref:TlpA family protein disulfide reductase n=1 Tax=Marmoricola sp. RAF53 TaxID=3233059 RepID=UPI003F96AA1C